jgi:hypothetical protein
MARYPSGAGWRGADARPTIRPGSSPGCCSRNRPISADSSDAACSKRFLDESFRRRRGRRRSARYRCWPAPAPPGRRTRRALFRTTARKQASARRSRCRHRPARRSGARQWPAGFSDTPARCPSSPASSVLPRARKCAAKTGKICTRFSSRVSSAASSSHDTAVRTRVSSVAESRSKAPSSSSARISPGVAIRSPSFATALALLSSRFLSERRMAWISLLSQPRPSRHAELAFDIFCRVEQNAACRCDRARRDRLPAGNFPANPECRHGSPAAHPACRSPCRRHWWRQ